MPEQPHELCHFFRQASEEIASEYQRIRQHSREDPGTAGDEGEENWRKLLERWLPKQYSIVTKGRILNAMGRLSPQVDVVILKPSYPAALADKKVYLAAGVAAAFECKLTLREDHIPDVFQNSVTLRNLLPRRRPNTLYHELNSSIVYGLLAHSHTWTNNENATTHVTKIIDKTDLSTVSRPIEMPDVFCIADVGTWKAFKRIERGPTGPIAQTTVYTGYSCGQPIDHPFHTPIGRFAADLIWRLAKQDAPLIEIAQYFYSVAGLMGAGTASARQWTATVLSPDTLERVINDGFSRNMWDNWSSIQ